MESTPALRSLIRRKTGESIPEGGSASDTMISDEDLDVIILSSPTINHAIVDVWEGKLAEWAGLVDVTDGAAGRRFGQLREGAENQIKYFKGLIAQGEGMPGRLGRTRVGSIKRRV